MSKEEWKFKEEHRVDVCKGKLCPKCLGTNIKQVNCNPDGRAMNYAYDCKDCGAQWEGY